MFRENELIFLLGAGCSYEAGIPTSEKMIIKLEQLIENDIVWSKYQELYHLIKSAANYSDGIRGKVSTFFDIERLVTILSELEKKENNIIYPFIGSWNPRLLEIASYDFKIIEEFKDNIVKSLTKWVRLEDYQKSAYYQYLYEFQKTLDYSLRVFTLNYDTCLERNKPNDFDLEIGFDPETRIWDWRRFERNDDYQPQMYLYKLHGSIDWLRLVDKGNIVKYVENYPENPDLIFGETNKVQSSDPYLFYIYELRKYSLESKVIVVIGYGFRDEHINTIFEQALLNSEDRVLVHVSPTANEKQEYLEKNRIFNSSVLPQFIPVCEKASEFLKKLDRTYLAECVSNKGQSFSD